MFEVGDKVINRTRTIGVVEAIYKTGQIRVKEKPNVWCTYDHDWMLRLV